MGPCRYPLSPSDQADTHKLLLQHLTIPSIHPSTDLCPEIGFIQMFIYHISSTHPHSIPYHTSIHRVIIHISSFVHVPPHPSSLCVSVYGVARFPWGAWGARHSHGAPLLISLSLFSLLSLSRPLRSTSGFFRCSGISLLLVAISL